MTLSDIPEAISESRVAKAAWWAENGVSRAMLRALVQSGDLVKTRRGVYATKTAVEESAKGPRAKHAYLVKSAIAATGGDTVACCSSAALIHGLELFRDPPEGVITLLRPDAWAHNRKPSGDIVLRSGALVPDGDDERRHVIESYGVRVTSTPRTVADLARTLPFIEGVVVADSALRKYGFRKKEYLHILNACRGWPGAERAREVIRFADRRAESPIESVLRVRLREWGFGPPQIQAGFFLSSGMVTVDFLYEEYKTVIETDGKGKMGPDYQYERQQRDGRLHDAGYKVVHVTGRELYGHPELVRARIRKAFDAPGPF